MKGLGLLLAICFLALPAAAQDQPEGRPCTAEPTDMAIGIDDVVTCSIAPIGDIDTFRFPAQAGDAVSIVVMGTGGQPEIELFNGSGVRVAGPANTGCCLPYARIDIKLAVAGTYTIRVGDLGSMRAMDYILVVNRISPASAAATPLRYGSRIRSAINPAGDVDLFTFSGTAEDRVIIQASNQGSGQPEIELFDSTGTRVAGPVNTGCCQAFARLDFRLPATGSYVIRLTDINNDTVLPYLLTLDRVGPVAPATTDITFGVGVNGDLVPPGDSDYYTFWGTAGSTVTIQATRLSGGQPELELFSAAGIRVAGPANTGCCLQFARIDYMVPATGMYTIRVADLGNDTLMTYRLDVQCVGACSANPRGNAPKPLQVSPASGTPTAEPYVFTFSDGDGAQDLDVVNVLINDFLDGRHACYLAYSRPLNVLYLVDDAGASLLPGLTLNGSGNVANSQCAVNGVGSAAAVSGNILTLTLRLSFTPAFAGNRVVYTAARDAIQNNSGWLALGTIAVPNIPAAPISVIGVAPARGTANPQTFSFTISDNLGAQDIGVVNVLINDSLDGRLACYVAYSRAANMIFLVNDSGTALLPGITPNTAGTSANSQCAISGTGSVATVNNNLLTLQLNITFAPAFAGNRLIYVAARNNAEGNNTGWQAMGSWTLP